MTRRLLVCGLIAGVLAGFVAAGFARVVGESAVDAAIAFEDAQTAASTDTQGPPVATVEHPEASLDSPEEETVVARTTQRGIGLLTAAAVFGLVVGGLFALGFVLAYGRWVQAGVFATALWLSLGAFVVMFLVPFLVYPSNPPAVGDPETIGRRTLLYWTMVGISVAAAGAALSVRRLAASRVAPRTAAAVGIACYTIMVIVAGRLMPTVQEIPADFPAVVLWEFRRATVGMQVVLWGVVGTVFGLLAQRVMRERGPLVPRSHGMPVGNGGSVT